MEFMMQVCRSTLGSIVVVLIGEISQLAMSFTGWDALIFFREPSAHSGWIETHHPSYVECGKALLTECENLTLGATKELGYVCGVPESVFGILLKVASI
jgi:hypothetical protein